MPTAQMALPPSAVLLKLAAVFVVLQKRHCVVGIEARMVRGCHNTPCAQLEAHFILPFHWDHATAPDRPRGSADTSGCVGRPRSRAARTSGYVTFHTSRTRQSAPPSPSASVRQGWVLTVDILVLASSGGDTVSQTPKMGSECGGGDAVAQSGLTMMPP